MYKRILYPFAPDRTFNSGYTWAMELASRMNAALFFFTTFPDSGENKKEFVDHLSHNLLEAQGNYLQHISHDVNPARTERHIGEGDFPFSLSRFVKKNRFDIVVIDPMASLLPQTTLNFVVENSDGVIVLPEHHIEVFPDAVPPPDPDKKITEDFYDVLHKAELYKLPENFFTTLGQDKRLFNYLRSFFKRRGNSSKS